MYKFDKELASFDSIDQLNAGFHLWIWNPNIKSPHLGISLDGKILFSTISGQTREF